MKLHTTPTSPYGRKCAMAAIAAGAASCFESVTADYKSNAYQKLNPLGKVPALELGDGTVLIDSPVIAAYLASLGDAAKVYPEDAAARWRALSLEALADGVLDAAVLVYVEERRPDGERSNAFIAKQLGKMNAGLDAIEAQAAAFGGTTHIGVLAVAAALGWIGLRHVGGDWRKGRPHLTAWLEAFSRRDCWTATLPPPGA